MEKRFILALVLCMVVLVVWQQFFVTKKKPPEKPPETTTEAPAAPKGETAGQAPGGGAAAPVLAPAPTIDPAKVQELVLENAKIRVVLTNVGAAVKAAEILDFHATAAARESSIPLRFLVPSEEGLHALRLDDREWPDAGLGDGLWEAKKGEDGRSVTFSRRAVRKTPEGELAYTVRKVFSLLPGDSRHLHLKIQYEFPGAADGTSLPKRFALLATGGVFQEVGGQAMTPATSAIGNVDGKLRLVPESEAEKADKEAKVAGGALATLRGQEGTGGVRVAVGGSVRFVADLSNYLGAFLSLKSFPVTTAVVHLLGDAGSRKVAGRADLGADSLRTVSVLLFEEALVRGGPPKEHEVVLYLGPKSTTFLDADLGGGGDLPAEAVKAMGEVYEGQLGWASFIGKAVLAALGFLHGVLGNWGWAIVALTFFVRLLLFPVNRRSQASMLHHQEAMARIKPKLEALKKKHEKDPRTYAQEQMKLMRAEKVPIMPLGGCLPLLLQIPIFFGLFAALRSSIDLRQAPWLWVKDLSQPDHLVAFASPWPNPLQLCGSCCGMPQAPITGFHLLPILMTIAWVASSAMMPKPQTSDPALEQQRKIMMFMPLVFGLMMYGYAAGLSLYWLTSSLLGIFESQVIKKVWPVKKPGEVVRPPVRG